MTGFINIFCGIAVAALMIFGNNIVAVSATACLYAVLLFLPKKCKSKSNIPIICIAAIIACCLISTAINGGEWHAASYQCIKLLVLGLPFFVDGEFCKKTIAPAAYLSIFLISVAQIICYCTDTFAHSYGTCNFMQLLRSVVGYPNTLCVLCLCGVWISLYLLKHRNKKAVALIGIIDLAAAVSTCSRLGFICFILSILVYVFIKYKASRPFIVTLMCIITIVALIAVTSGYYKALLGSSMVNRFVCWQDAAAVILKNPWGIGAGNWQNLQYNIQSADYSVIQIHNSFLQMALDNGISAFIIFCMLIVYSIKQMRKNAVLLSITAFILMHAFVDMDFYFISIFALLGICLRMTEEDKVVENIYLHLGIVCLLIFNSAVYIICPKTESRLEHIVDKYQQAYIENKYDDMYNASLEWIEYAPKQQEAYDSYKKAISKSGNAVRLYINGVDYTLKAPPLKLGDKIFIPLKTTAAAGRYKVQWDEIKQQAEISREGSVRRIKVKNNLHRMKSGQLKQELADISIIGNHLMIDMNMIEEELLAQIKFNENENSIYITY